MPAKKSTGTKTTATKAGSTTKPKKKTTAAAAKSTTAKKPNTASESKNGSGKKPVTVSKKSGSNGKNKISVDPGIRQKMIAEAAYYIAESRGFVGGNPEMDWITAENQIDRLLHQRH